MDELRSQILVGRVGEAVTADNISFVPAPMSHSAMNALRRMIAEEQRARILASYFGHVSPVELEHRFKPLPFGLRSGKYGPAA